MGITVRDMLESEFFKDFEIITGHKGLDKQIQGIAILDSPDGFQWTKGREFVISSGYVFKENPELFREYLESEMIKEISGIGIKLDRYFKEIPKDIIDEFDKQDIPLLKIPLEPSWMDIMNGLNVTIMNKNIKQFKIGNINPKSFSDKSYHTRKINKILSQIEGEMNFPTMLYDLGKDKPYFSSSKFVELADGLELKDFWKPSFDYTQEILCDNLKIKRYRFIDKERYDRPYSWITIPITVGNTVEAYFVVVEATELIDYFDQFALRIGFILLQSLYEQILVAESIEDLGFEKFIEEIIGENISTKELINKRACDLGLDLNSKYYLISMKQIKEGISLLEYKDEIWSSFSNSISLINGRIAIINDSTCVFLIAINNKMSKEDLLNNIKESIEDFKSRLLKRVKEIELLFGFSDVAGYISEINRNYTRAEQTIKIGKILYPDEDYLTYSKLGVFAWIDIKEDEMEIMLEDVEFLIKDQESQELIQTLEVYLESNMNYSLTAKKLFIHINTVRKRIDRIDSLISFDLEDPMNRLNLEILLKLIKQ